MVESTLLRSLSTQFLFSAEEFGWVTPLMNLPGKQAEERLFGDEICL
jgi:hypothetical protein